MATTIIKFRPTPFFQRSAAASTSWNSPVECLRTFATIPATVSNNWLSGTPSHATEPAQHSDQEQIVRRQNTTPTNPSAMDVIPEKPKPLVADNPSLIPLLASALLILLPAAFFLLRQHLQSRSAVAGQQAAAAASPALPPADEIVSLRIYPIKSCRGIEVRSARLLRTGLDLDRNWMFVSLPKRDFVTIRTNPRLTLITTAVDWAADTLTIAIKDGNENDENHKIVIPAHPSPAWFAANGCTLHAGNVIWSQETDGWEYPAALTAPFARFLSGSDANDVRLVYKGPTPRVLRGSGAPHVLGRTQATKFADMMPVQVGSLASVAELNARLRGAGEEVEIDIERFRPNVVVRGHVPWDEDGWKTLRLGGGEGGVGGKGKGLVLDVVCRCLRCQVPNVDPETAEKHPRQPWNELMKYRRIDEGLKFKPSFGMLCAPRDEGLVEVGMRFEVTETTNNHYFVSPMK
ncbi:mosc-domain-containing protein [Diplodia corticola]|uniref:Mosc-domain-containing protein n=1 Tax=Diplodia corticola TaxID=236234 RepID=A0A1J9R044_9PEZI|nr:mosc-domain-containing protein [Diplodia corticola]OJD34000.1 mosc-domain-containing protein [Diplodia corticola]